MKSAPNVAPDVVHAMDALVFKHSQEDAREAKKEFGDNYERYCAFCEQFRIAESSEEGRVGCVVVPVSREVYMSLVVNTYERHVRKTFNTMPEQAADIVRSLLSMHSAAWHTYDDELVNMHISDSMEAVLSLCTGKLTIWEWV